MQLLRDHKPPAVLHQPGAPKLQCWHPTLQTSGRKDWECLWIGINIYVDKIQNHCES